VRSSIEAEAPCCWSLMAEVWPAYDEYKAKTDREIPVVVFARR
jgi:F420H(2)-dependent quinone reductase